MSPLLIVFIVVLAVEFVAVLGSMTFSIVRDKRNPQPAKTEEPVKAEEIAEEVVEEEVATAEEIPAEEVVETPAEEPAAVEGAAVVADVEEAEEYESEDDADDEGADEDDGVVVGGTAGGSSDSKRRIPFAEKMLYIDKKTQGYYNIIMNKFKGLRRINIRVSSKGVSYRLGRELVAKLTVRGKTMKLHLALDVNAYDAKIYFQKDLSAVKSYAEVPFAVKVKSDRGLKNALKLIDALVATKGIQEKTRFNEMDGVEDLKAIALKNRR